MPIYLFSCLFFAIYFWQNSLFFFSIIIFIKIFILLFDDSLFIWTTWLWRCVNSKQINDLSCWLVCHIQNKRVVNLKPFRNLSVTYRSIYLSKNCFSFIQPKIDHLSSVIFLIQLKSEWSIIKFICKLFKFICNILFLFYILKILKYVWVLKLK